MLELQTLTFNNIGRFVTEQTIDFTNRSKLIQIDGKNLNTGGSSGAAKTTIINAIGYLLGTNDLPKTILQSRLTKKIIYVKGTFLDNGKSITIVRHGKDGLSIEDSENSTTGSTKISEEKLDEIIKIPRSIFKKMIHKKQKERGFFLKMTGKEIYQFLIKMLGLEYYLVKIEQITEDIKNINTAICQKMTVIDNYKSSIIDLDNLKTSKQKPTCVVTIEEIYNLFGQLSELEKELNNIKNKKDNIFKELTEEKELKIFEKNKEISQLKQPIKTSAIFDNVQLDNLKTQIITLNKEKDEILQKQVKFKDEIKDEIRIIKNTLENISRIKKDVIKRGSEISKLNQEYQTITKESNCPTCKQKWINEDSTKKAQEINDNIQKKVKEVLELKKIIDEEPALTLKLEEFYNKLNLPNDNSKILEINNKITELDSLIATERAKKLNIEKELENIYLKQKSDYLSQINYIESKYNNTNNEKQQQFDFIKEEYDKVQTRYVQSQKSYNEQSSIYTNYKNNLNNYEIELSNLNKIINEKKKLLSNTEIELLNFDKKIKIAEEAKRLIKTYTLKIFQETLDSIGEKATQILNSIPNMVNATIFFESFKENKDGSLRDEVTAILNVDGENDIPIKSLSGGEESSVDICIDISLIDIIEQKMGLGVNFMILDEPFDGLDSICRENCLEMLKQLDTNKKIIIVDHSSELKEMVNDIILVTRNGETSTVQ